MSINRFLSVSSMVIIFFFSIFYVKLPVVSNSLFLIGFFTILMMSMPKYRAVVKYVFLNKNLIYTFLIFLIPIFSYSVITLVTGNNDFSFLYTMFSYFVYTATFILVSSCFLLKYRSFSLEKIIFGIFLIQSIIIIMAFLSPTIRDFVQLFQSDGAREIATQQHNIGIRGLALSSQQYFGLALIYCVLYLFYSFWLVNKKIGINSILIFFVILITSVTIARTVFVGLLFSMVFLMLTINNKLVLRVVLYTFLLSLISVCGLYYVYAQGTNEQIVYAMNWAFELFFNILNGGGAHTASTSSLSNMYFPLTESQYIFGDGKYLNSDGSYYKSTDAGYMRMLLAGGGAMLFFIVYDLFLIQFLIQVLSGFRHRKKFGVLLFILFLILNIKGEVIGYSVGAHLLIILFIVKGLVDKYYKSNHDRSAENNVL